MVVYRECSVARLGEFRHEYASAVTRAAGGVREVQSPKPISQEKPSPRSGESSSRTELRDSREKRPLPMEDITTENQPSLRRSLRIKKSNPKYMQADFADAVSLSQCCVSEIGKGSIQ
ncbi:hypothetical protein Q3G72_017563 [Acer saccharum]|nr:hypothetical protein Q3G72_017563 [Acer saccharum]